jgi:hypothetical protein
MMVFLLAFAGCQKDDAATVDETKPESLLLGGETGPEERDIRCNCQYQIVSVDYTPAAPVGNQFNYGVFAVENCEVGVNCKRFSFSEGCDFTTDALCTLIEPAGLTKPTQWYPFNCTQSFFSSFSVKVANAIFTNSNCAGTPNNAPRGTLVLKVRCAASSCGEGYFESNAVSIPFSGGNSYIDGEFELAGCGCQPSGLITW